MDLPLVIHYTMMESTQAVHSNSVLNLILPLIDWNIGAENQRITRNIDSFKFVLKGTIKLKRMKRLHESSEEVSNDFLLDLFLDLLNQSICTEDELIDDLLAYLFAGTHTGASALQSFFYNIKRRPETLEKVRQELEEKIFENGAFDLRDLGGEQNLAADEGKAYLSCCTSPGKLVQEVVHGQDTFFYTSPRNYKESGT